MNHSTSPETANTELRRSEAVTYVPIDVENGLETRKPTNAFVTPLLTDLYQITMAYAMWKSNRHEIPAAFDLFFRKNPFGGEFTIFAGLEEVIRFVSDFHFNAQHIDYIRTVLPNADPKFFDWLATVDCSALRIHAIREGSVVFPRVPLIRVEGPMAISQLLESTLLCLVNYPSLVATNAARHRLVVGPEKTILEFGLRRAQGPDGAVSATRYAYLGGCDGSSNTMSGYLFGIPVRGTMAHSYVTSFASLQDFEERDIVDTHGKTHPDFYDIVLSYLKKLGYTYTNTGELIAFAAYARTFPESFLALVDTYDTIHSGIKNFICVALALHELGYKPIGIRLDSGDLAYLSKEARKIFKQVAQEFKIDYFADLAIAASNDLNEATIASLNAQGHEIDIFAIGTNLVTCQAQPALGCVYKLVEVEGDPRIKLSQEVAKVTLAGRKEAFRLFSKQGHPLLDLLVNMEAPESERPTPGERILCLHPFEEQKRVYVTPYKVEPLHVLVWDQGKVCIDLPTLRETRDFCRTQLSVMREDHLRALNPAPYKVSVTKNLYKKIHALWLREVPIQELK